MVNEHSVFSTGNFNLGVECSNVYLGTRQGSQGLQGFTLTCQEAVGDILIPLNPGIRHRTESPEKSSPKLHAHLPLRTFLHAARPPIQFASTTTPKHQLPFPPHTYKMSKPSNPGDPVNGVTSTSHNDTYPFIAPTKNDFHNKHVFITGASKGIGRATAISYATGGASCIGLSARSSLDEVVSECEAAAQKAGHSTPKVLVYAMDVVDRDAIDKTAAAVAKDMEGRLDLLINNAGYLEDWKPIVESDPDEWWKTWTVNMRGPYLVTRAFLPLMLKGGDKTIVNLSSVGAHKKRPGASAYQTTKFAIARLTEFIEAEYGDDGVIAFCVHPGGILTALAQNMPKDIHSGKFTPGRVPIAMEATMGVWKG